MLQHRSALSVGFKRRAVTKIADSALGLDRLTYFYQSIPATGPAIAVANHPFGALDGLLLAQLLLKRRPDVLILTNRILSVIPGRSPRKLCRVRSPPAPAMSRPRDRSRPPR